MSRSPDRLSFDDLDRRAADFDAAVAVTPEIDRFCSSSAWILPAHRAFSPIAEPLLLEAPGGFVALQTIMLRDRTVAALPLEASWGLASPFVGPDPEPLVVALRDVLVRPGPRPGPVWDLVVLSGIQADGRAFRALVRAMYPLYEIRIGPRTGRVVASLVGGLEGFLSRRTSKFRAVARRARRHAGRDGYTYQYQRSFTADEAEATYARVIALEYRSWKGQGEQGIEQEPARTFYHLMVRRLAAQGGLRAAFVQRDGEDVAYIFGGVLGDTYRGLQCSFADEHARASPGVLAHLEMIDRVAAEGLRVYDLGTDMDYKHRWGQPGLDTITCVVLAR